MRHTRLTLHTTLILLASARIPGVSAGHAGVRVSRAVVSATIVEIPAPPTMRDIQSAQLQKLLSVATAGIVILGPYLAAFRAPATVVSVATHGAVPGFLNISPFRWAR